MNKNFKFALIATAAAVMAYKASRWYEDYMQALAGYRTSYRRLGSVSKGELNHINRTYRNEPEP